MSHHMRNLLGPAGGLRYHLRAWRHSADGWEPFRQALGQWLDQWHPPERELILVGPSAGYCLRPELVARFEKVICLEPDPLARLLFRHRLRPRQMLSVDQDFFTTPAFEQGISAFERFLRKHPGAAVVFTNFLGQLRLLVPERRESQVLRAWKQCLETLLSSRSWASFHDRVSGAIVPSFRQPLYAPKRLSDDELLTRCYSDGTRGELIDHCTDGFFRNDREHAYFAWRLFARQWHIIEGVRSSCRAP